MISFDTEVAKYANKIVHTKENLKDILLEIDSTISEGLFSQDDKGNTIFHYMVSKNAVQPFMDVIELTKKIPSLMPGRCKHKSCDCLALILNTANHKGMTALHVAAGIKANLIAKQLLNQGADLFAQNQDKFTPLEIAIKSDNAEFLEMLSGLEQGKEILSLKFAGKSLLHLAVEYSALEVIELLCSFEKLKLVNSRDFTKSTPLIFAASLGNKEVIASLINNGSNLELNNGQHKSAAEIALEKGHYSVVPLLVRNGAKIEAPLANEFGYSRTKELVMTLVSHLVDSRGTFVGLRKDSSLNSRLRDDLMRKIKEFKFTDKSLQNVEPCVDNLIVALTEIKILSLSAARNQEEITKILAPHINKFIGEIAYE
ncbi:MAG: ankyrin repeat protein [Rickettsiaceae bacterium]|jgi:ankyrin repeat protein|nr:ankyrin repeat protein [Rickettsiaceae bacterium]